ncbi:hypothetical protein BV25DRAFT_1991326, partial [Artomyces pyxidatus]
MLTPLLFACAFLISPSGGLPMASLPASLLTNGTVPSALAAVHPPAACKDIDSCRTRGTIICSSLVTILACVWTAVHRNIPGPSPPGELRLRRFVLRMLEMMKIVVATSLVPEWVLAWAVRQFLNARDLARELEAVRCPAEGAWKEKGWLEGDAGCLTRCRCSGRQTFSKSSLALDEHAGRLRDKWTTRHGFFVIMGGFYLYRNGEPQHPLSRQEVVKLVKAGDLVPPTEDEIRGWSQGDSLSKSFAIAQTLWFIVQCIARPIEHLPITQLELVTLAYTAITFAMYGAWWHKPQNVGSSVRVAMAELPEQEQPRQPARYWRIYEVMAGAQPDIYVDLRKQSCVPTFYGGSIGGDDNAAASADLIAVVAAMIFGAVHCAAWNSAFPSRTEELIWRVSSAVIVAIPGAIVLVPAGFSGLGYENFFGGTHLLLCFLAGPMYIAARMVLLVLSFTTLWSLPYQAYQTVQWTLRMPHVA